MNTGYWLHKEDEVNMIFTKFHVNCTGEIPEPHHFDMVGVVEPAIHADHSMTSMWARKKYLL